MFEDLTTYTEVDQNSDITITSPKADFVSLDRIANSYVYKDHGIDYFGDFDIDFEFYIQEGADQGLVVLFAVSNTSGTLNDMISATDGLTVFAYNNTNNLAITIQDWSNSNYDTYIFGGGTTSGVIYSTISRSVTTLTMSMFSDANRTVPIDILTLTSEAGTKRYLTVLASCESAVSGGDAITGYTQNFEIIYASSSSSSISSSSVSSSSVSSSSSSSSLSSSSSSLSSSSSSLSSSSSSSSLSSSSSSSSSSLSSSSSSSSLSSSSSSISSSSSSSSSSLSSSSSSSSISSSSSSKASNGAWIFGEENPTMGEEPVSWQT